MAPAIVGVRQALASVLRPCLIKQLGWVPFKVAVTTQKSQAGVGLISGVRVVGDVPCSFLVWEGVFRRGDWCGLVITKVLEDHRAPGVADRKC